MKKTKIITVLSAAFLTAAALASCSIVKSKDGVVLIYDGVEYTAEELFNDQKTPAAAEAKFNAVYKVAVRHYFEEGQDGHAYMDQITLDTKNKISGQKATAQSNADTNGTSYDTEWQKILDANNVDDEQGLYNKFEYELQKEKFEDKFYEDNYDQLRNGNPFPKSVTTGGNKFVNYLQGKQPYHMKHILVKVGAKDGDNNFGEITADEAIKLHKVIKALAEGKSFEEVSDTFSDDETAKKDHSSLGIMSRDTSFVNDFKLGTYLYESFFGSSTPNARAALDLAHTTDEEKAGYFAEQIANTDMSGDSVDPTTGYGIGQIPYEAALALGEDEYTDPADSSKVKKGLAKVDLTNQEYKQAFDDAGVISDVKAKFLPRNVIFNKYFNKHNIMVITPTTLPTINIGSYTDGHKRTAADTHDLGNSADYAAKKGFTHTPKNGDVISTSIINNKVLRDDNGRVILVFRSGSGSGDSGYQGIHFVVIERSPFIASETDDGHAGDPTSLNDYYTHYYPNQDGGKHPTYSDNKTYRHTFVNYVTGETDAKKLKSRADTVKSELKKADSHMNLYIYDYLSNLKDTPIQFHGELGEAIKNDINTWKDVTLDTTVRDNKKSWNNTWETYYYNLMAQQEQREEVQVDTNEWRGGLTPEVCVTVWIQKYNLKTMFDAGGVFHE